MLLKFKHLQFKYVTNKENGWISVRVITKLKHFGIQAARAQVKMPNNITVKYYLTK